MIFFFASEQLYNERLASASAAWRSVVGVSVARLQVSRIWSSTPYSISLNCWLSINALQYSN